MDLIIAFLIATGLLWALNGSESALGSYGRRTWIAFDNLICCWLFFGHEDETISGLAGKRRRQGRKVWTMFANAIDWVFYTLVRGVAHCDNAIEWDEKTPSYKASRIEKALGLFFVVSVTLIVYQWLSGGTMELIRQLEPVFKYLIVVFT